MVDFAHTKELAESEKDLDEDYLYGLRTLIRFIESVSAQLVVIVRVSH